MRRTTVVVSLAVAVIVSVIGVQVGRRLQTLRRIDRTYSEAFPPPTLLAPSVRGKRIVFHMKTGLAQDDSQICVGFNVILAALQAGADVTVIFDAGAVLDLSDGRHNLERTSVPERLAKVIVAQTHIPAERAPANYRAYLDLLHALGAKVYADTEINVVTGVSDKVLRGFAKYPYVLPIPYAGIVEQISTAQTLIVY